MRRPVELARRRPRGVRGAPVLGRRRGYTLIEVLMALAVLTVGAAGILGMHRAATRGNMIAREISTATQLAERWVGRLRRDSLHWTQPATTANPLLLTQTSYLDQVPAPGNAIPWFVPAPPGGTGEFANFDYYGRDTATPGEMHYCTNVRLEWIYPGRAMRADVRIWFARRGTGRENIGSDMQNLAGCAGGGDPNGLTNDFRVRAVYTSTVIRYQPLPRQ
ncbi:MAG: prepilin-type N-terminal cleavage/methylation domain-containing protein [Sandaracinaceae bacterium]